MTRHIYDVFGPKVLTLVLKDRLVDSKGYKRRFWDCLMAILPDVAISYAVQLMGFMSRLRGSSSLGSFRIVFIIYAASFQFMRYSMTGQGCWLLDGLPVYQQVKLVSLACSTLPLMLDMLGEYLDARRRSFLPLYPEEQNPQVQRVLGQFALMSKRLALIAQRASKGNQ